MLYDTELHSVEGIRRYFDQGGDPTEINDGIPLFTMMMEMYTRTPRFKDCVRVFIDKGLVFTDEALLSVLTDDSEKLEKQLQTDQTIINKTYFLFNNAYTPLSGGTLLHFCAEHNSTDCAKILVSCGADVN